MKIKIPFGRITNIIKKYKTLIVTICVVLFLAAMLAGAYVAISPPEDRTAAQKGEGKLQSLNIQFDKKTIEELQKETAPTNIQGAAGRNPFMPY